MKNRKTEKLRGENSFNLVLLYLILIVFCFPIISFAQTEETALSQTPTNQASVADEEPLDVAPPPLKILSQDERKTLDAENSLKKRTQLSLGMMEARLMRAEQLTSSDNFKQSIEDLAAFQALLENTFTYLEKNDIKNKADGRFKQLEIFLRKQVPRLETLRRTMPYKFGYYVLKLMKVVREARAKAVEPLFAEPLAPSKQS